ncbi:MAG: V-type ATP synthase subunit E [Candidatus Thorarchaeota archaeon]
MSGLESIINMIDEKTSEKVDSILKQAEEQKKTLIKQAEEKAKGIEEKILKAADLEYEADIARRKAGAKLKSKYLILEAKENILVENLENVEKELKKVVKSKKYKAILTHLIVDGGVALNVDKLELVFPKGQDKLITLASIAKEIGAKTGRKVAVTISKDRVHSTGGVIIRTLDGKKFVDNTFESRLERFQNDIRDKVSAIVSQE